MKRLMLALLFLVASWPAHAQIATPASRFSWDQVAPDAATANGYVYRLYVDGAATGTVVAATCAAVGTTISCETPIAAFTPGSHTLQVSASNVAGESPKSTLFTFTMVLVPATPTNIGIK